MKQPGFNMDSMESKAGFFRGSYHVLDKVVVSRICFSLPRDLRGTYVEELVSGDGFYYPAM